MMYPKQGRTRLSPVKRNELYAEVLERDNYQCQAPGCAGNALDPPHHIIYKSHNGSDCSWNLVTLCQDCHRMIHDHGTLRVYHDILNVENLISFLENPVPFLIFEEIK
jgi:5-methylcytosine-specific restriction endonuclease McrA